MNTVIRFIARQCTVAAFLCLGYALLQSFRVGEGLWQGSGLHGYITEISKGHNEQIVSVWASFVKLLIAAGLAGFFGLTVRLSRRSLNTRGELP